MRRITLTVNGAAVSAEIEPRTQLADFLRDTCLLTGTHIGCEHGICGACTVLLDDAPARSCIAYAAACEGMAVRTIEGLQDDPIMQRLRDAFTAEHALQCGYCTPGMLVTARDIVLRLPHADAARIRLELAGNLCRCTGYTGIVRAISRVLREDSVRPQIPPPQPLAVLNAPLPSGPTVNRESPSPAAAASPAATPRQDGAALQLTIALNRPRDDIWAALHDPALLAACVPGAQVTRAENGELEGTIRVALGPITAVFAGTGRLSLDAAAHCATLAGEGSDKRSHTHLSGTATITLQATGNARTQVLLQLGYALRGPLAPFARGPVVQALTAGIADTVARNLERRLAGDGDTAAPARFSAVGLLLRAVWQRLRRWLQSI
jgi:aerobic carbon-monoxide dehydrogenase small subunit